MGRAKNILRLLSIEKRKKVKKKCFLIGKKIFADQKNTTPKGENKGKDERTKGERGLEDSSSPSPHKARKKPPRLRDGFGLIGWLRVRDLSLRFVAQTCNRGI